LPQPCGTPVVQFANADGTTAKALMTPGASGSRLDALFATSSDTVSNVLQLSVLKSGVTYIVGEVTIPANAGTNGVVKSVSVLNSTDLPALAGTEAGALYLESGAVLQGRMKTAAAGAFVVQLVGVGADY
jgi:hypothetical protein